MSPRDLVPRQSGGETASETASGTQASSLPTNTDVTDTASPTNSLQGTSTQIPTTDSTAPIATSTLNATSPSSSPDGQSSSSSVSSAPPTSTTSPSTTAPPSTTSASQPPTTTQPSSSTTPSPTSSSNSPTSTPSSSTTHPSSQSPSSSPPPTSTTTPPPESGTPTTITSSYTTYLNGTPVATHSLIPSTIPAPHNSTSNNRTAIIAGSAAGAAVLIIIVLSIAFYSRRKHFKRLKFLDAITSRRKQAHSRAMLLAGEDLDDVDLARPPPGRYSDYETPWDGSSPPGSQRSLMGAAPRPPTHRSTPSDTGSAFREDVWPPPSETSRLMDPLARGADVDLSRIVDDVMGPPVHAVHFSQQSISSSHRGSGYESDGSRGEELHSRNLSNTSQVALLEAAGLAPVTATTNAPARSSPLTQAGNSPSSAGHGGGDPS